MEMSDKVNEHVNNTGPDQVAARIQGLDFDQTKELIRKNKCWLEHGDIKVIAARHGVERTLAYDQLNGKTKALKIAFIAEVLQKALENCALIKGKLISIEKLNPQPYDRKTPTNNRAQQRSATHG